MASSTSRSLLLLFVFTLLLQCSTSSRSFPSIRKLTQEYSSIRAIYSFGDSMADTGNFLIEGVKNGSFAGIANLPYGETTFGQATGRCSDGLLMIDYIARDLGLPLLNPYLDKQANFDNGVNFAVAGATALDRSFFAQEATLPPFTSSSLGVQFGWFKDYLKTICSSQEDCALVINNALFFVGEIGSNDYIYALVARQTIKEVHQMIPVVVQKIISVARELLDMGATRLVIPGIFPIGCMPGYLTLVNSSNPNDYDENNCLTSLNALATIHNANLFEAIQNLQASYPDAVILRSDYFKALRFLFNNALNLGFDETSLTKACCGGGGGQYNYDGSRLCGSPGTTVCADPSKYISWDGIHLTQHAHELMTKKLIEKFTYPLGGVERISPSPPSLRSGDNEGSPSSVRLRWAWLNY